MGMASLFRAAFLLLLAGPVVAGAAVPAAPYLEDFTADSAQWASPAAFATHVIGGGPDLGNYVSVDRNATQITFGTSVTVFTGLDSLDSSSDKFVGDWLAGGIKRFSAYVIHNAPQPLSFSTRFATSGNFPGTTTIDMLVQPNTWTLLSYDIDPSSVNVTLFPEGPPSVFTQTFTDIGNIQMFFAVPPSMTGDMTNYTFGLDKVTTSFVPEPASWLFALGAALRGVGLRKRRGAVLKAE
jgi:hypothetical protein